MCQDGLSGAGLATDDVKSGVEDQVGAVNDRQVLDVEFDKQKRRRLTWEAG